MDPSSPLDSNENKGNRRRSRGLRSNKSGNFGNNDDSSSESANRTPNKNKTKSNQATSADQQGHDETSRSSGRASRRNRPKQVDPNYVDSGKVFQTLKRQSSKDISSLDAESNILARLDHDSYKNTMLKDADRILHTFLLPMSIPWSKHQPYSDFVKDFPKDIDEMPEVLGMDDHSRVPFENGTFGYGKFEVGKSPKAVSPDYEGGIRAALRRSDDPGVIEMTTVNFDRLEAASNNISRNLFAKNSATPEKAMSSSRQSLRRSNRKRKHGRSRSEQSMPLRMLDYFRTTQTEKNRKLEIAKQNVEKKFVSIRFGSTSSRASIFYCQKSTDQDSDSAEDVDAANAEIAPRPLLVKVNLPLEVQTGRNLIFTEAAKSVKLLGSYDMRFGMSKETPPPSASKTKRKTTGRTRLLWTKAHISGGCSSDSVSSKHKLAYSSLLTGNRIDISCFRRPREVKLAVKVNGELLHLNKDVTFNSKSRLENQSGDNHVNVAAASGISQKAVSDAITAAAKSSRTRSRCNSISGNESLSQNKGVAVCIFESDEFSLKTSEKKKSRSSCSKTCRKNGCVFG
mmetsp:Transcript_30528/g.46242  ORF Transcript_30528/g.46242 Transcript_30528/m.46242 type:complete len:569 (-) Transcript_30528:5788-7494(-)